MKYRIKHVTTYRYGDGADACFNVVRLQPRTLPGQRAQETTLAIHPVPASMRSYDDYFGNRVHSFDVYEPHFTMSITAESLVTLDRVEPALAPSPSCAEVRKQLRNDRSARGVEALEYVFDSPYVARSPAVRDFAARFCTDDKKLLPAVLELTDFIHGEFTYDAKATTVDTSVDTVLEKKRGVCQDFAHLQIACLRSQGLACRYVSGYLRTDPLPGRSRLLGADASHAWVSVFCPVNGWIDLDPTNGCVVGPRHITIGWGRDFHDVSPVKGVVLGGGESKLTVGVDVEPLP
jgi:transglutaminase-like putative cysteine protease